MSVDRGGEIEFVKAYGFTHRAHQIPNTAGTRFAIASGSKGLTALTVVSLSNDNALSTSTTAGSVLGTDYVLTVPAQDLGSTGSTWRPRLHRNLQQLRWRLASDQVPG